MSAEPNTLDTAGVRQLNLSTSSGNITVVAEERPDIVIESGAPDQDKIHRGKPWGPKGAIFGDSPRHKHASTDDGEIHFHSAKKGTANLVVRCPSGFDMVIGTASGDVHLLGRYGQVRVTTASGRIEVDSAEEMDLRSISGSILVDSCLGGCRLQTVSGKTELRSGERIEASTVSGKIQIVETKGDIKVRSVSGNVEIGTEGTGGVAIQTVSGSVRVEVPGDCRPHAQLMSLASRPHCELPEGDDFEIKVKSMRGKIDVVSR
jgi:DUF4097 and DUF4098 domain-containing protein YvlB